MKDAKKSILFSIMGMHETGNILDNLKKISKRDKIFSIGVTQMIKASKALLPMIITQILLVSSILKNKLQINSKKKLLVVQDK